MGTVRRRSYCGLPPVHLRFRDDLKPPDAGRPIYLEIATVQGEDTRNAFALGHGDERRVSKIHGQVAVLLHQLAHAAVVASLELDKTDHIALHQLPQCVLGAPGKAEEIHRFCVRRPHRRERLVQCSQHRGAAFMVAIVSVYQGDQRARIDQNHGY